MKKKNIKNLNINKSLFAIISSIVIGNIGLCAAEACRPIKVVEASNQDIKLSNSKIELMGFEEFDEDEQFNEQLEQLQEEKEQEEKITMDYSGMPIDHEYEEYLYELSEQYGVPFELIMTFGYIESNGTWETNGKISATNDYGQFQINRCNHRSIMKHFGWADSVNEVSEILLWDREKNAEAAVWLMSNILNDSHCKNIEWAIGMYNGYIHWQHNSWSVRYKNEGMSVMNEYFDDKIDEINEYIADLRNNRRNINEENKENNNNNNLNLNNKDVQFAKLDTNYVKKLV